MHHAPPRLPVSQTMKSEQKLDHKNETNKNTLDVFNGSNRIDPPQFHVIGYCLFLTASTTGTCISHTHAIRHPILTFRLRPFPFTNCSIKSQTRQDRQPRQTEEHDTNTLYKYIIQIYVYNEKRVSWRGEKYIPNKNKQINDNSTDRSGNEM